MQRLNFKSWLFHHQMSSTESLRRVLSKPFLSIMIWFLIGVAMSLPIIGFVFFKNADDLALKIVLQPSLTLFLDATIDEPEARLVAQEVRANHHVDDLEFLTAEKALSEFAEESGFGDLLAGLENNPIPPTIFVTLNSRLSFEEVAMFQAELVSMPRVSQVIIDTAWLERLKNIVSTGYRVIVFTGFLLSTAVVLVISNMVRMAIISRQEEIVVTKLVGGSEGFVRRPFLYMGLWYGLGGGIIASTLILLVQELVRGPVEALLDSYQSDHVFVGINPFGALEISILGGVLGLLGAWGSFVRQVRLIEP